MPAQRPGQYGVTPTYEWDTKLQLGDIDTWIADRKGASILFLNQGLNERQIHLDTSTTLSSKPVRTVLLFVTDRVLLL